MSWLLKVSRPVKVATLFVTLAFTGEVGAPLQSLAGADPSGSEAAVRKLLGVQQDQRVQEVGMWLMGPDAAATDGEAAAWSSAFLFNRCLTIAGGTSDVQRNVIAERLLGLPRDPEPGQ